MENLVLPEQQLIEALKKGNEEAYKQAFFAHFEPLTYFACKYLGDMDAARDIVQDVFSVLYEKREKLDITTSLKSYLYRAVTNRSLNAIKSRKVHAEHHEDIRLKSGEGMDDQSLEMQELELRIQKVIDSLPKQCAHIFRLSRFEQKSNAEIAETLGISKRTVETQISNALKTLRKSLKIIMIEFFIQFFS